MEKISGVRPMALANLIHSAQAPNSAAYNATLKNIRDCIAFGDVWFLEEVECGFRVSTDSGFSAIVPSKMFVMSSH